MNQAGKDANLEDGLNKLGAQGWELVAIEPGVPKPSSVAAADGDSNQHLGYIMPPIYYFKRQKQ